MGLLDNFTNWAQSSQSQPAADGLLAAGLGILANNRGLTSGTQAIGMGGLQGLQAYQGSKQLQMQQALQSMQLQGLGINNAIAMQNYKDSQNPALWGGGSPPPQAVPQAPPMPGASDVGGMPAGSQGSGPSAQSMPVPMGAGGPPVGGGAPMPQGAPPPQMPQGAAPAPTQQPAAPQGGASPMNPLGLPVPLAQSWFRRDPGGYFKDAVAPAYSPTDLQKTMRAAGIDPNSTLGHQILQQSIAKTNYIAPTSLRPGGFYKDPDGTVRALPDAAPAGYQNVPDGNGGFVQAQMPGGLAAVTGSAAAKARGSAGYKTQEVYNPATKQMEIQPVTNIVDQANGGAPGNAPAPIRNNNPGAMMPGGKLSTYPTMEAGISALDGNLQSYGKQGVNTLAGVISKWAPPNENDTNAYIQDVSQRLGLKPDQQIDLGNPLVRHAISAGIALHENGPQGVFGQPGAQGSPAQPQSGAFAAAPPLGVVTNTDTSQKGGAEAMNTSFKALQGARASGQQALEGLDKMQSLAASKSVMSAGPLGTELTAVNPSAAEYEKQRANVITFLAGQNGTNGSDAGRALTGQSVPDYGKPQSAIKDGLGTLSNQIRLNMLKSNVLTPVFNQGDSKTYNDLENQFDQSVKPSMMPALNNVLGMPAGQARAAALSNAAKDPQMRSALEVLIKGGALK